MSPEAWITLGVGLTTIGLGIIAWIWKFGKDMGEIKSGVKELLCRDERTNKRVDTIELRLNDHTERIARLEGREG